MNRRSFLIRDCLSLALIVGVALLAACMAGMSVAAPIEYPMPAVVETAETGIIFNRGDKEQAEPRTEPYTPETAPLFESIPATEPATATAAVEPAPPAAPPVSPAQPTFNTQGVIVSDPLYQTPTALTPEQKEALKSLLIQGITLLVGALMGSGAASPFMAMILEKLLGAVKGANPAAPAAPTPARTRRRATRAKKKATPAK